MKELSRKDALNNLFIMRLQSKSTTEMKTIEMAMEALEERQTTYFVGHDNPNFSPFDNSQEMIYYCAECGRKVLFNFNYCPYCGLKVEGYGHER